MIDAQLTKEATIRARVQQWHDSLVKGLRLTQALMQGSSQVEVSLPQLTPLLLAVLQQRGELLVGRLFSDTFLVNDSLYVYTQLTNIDICV